MFVHSSRIKKQVEHLQFLGVDTQGMLERAEIESGEIDDPDKMFSFEQFHSVLEFALEKTGDEFYGLKMGSQPHIAGTIGMMCASCRNLEEAFVQGCKFFQVQGNFADISFVDDDHYPKIVYTLTHAWLLKYPETARLEVEAMFSFLSTIMKVNSNDSIGPYRIKLSHKAPKDTQLYEEYWGLIPDFESEANEIIFRKKDLLIPMKAFNPETFELLKAHVEKKLKKLNNEETMTDKVKNILLSSFQYQFPDIEKVASLLNLSTRTLQRQLSNENTSYKFILRDLRTDLARQMLLKDSLTISEISYTLGYSDIGNFSRSFKKISGMSPQEFRVKNSN